MLVTLVDDGLITLDVALSKSNMSEEEFRAQRQKLMDNDD